MSAHYKPNKALQAIITDCVAAICQTHGSDVAWRRFWACLGMMVGEAEANVLKALMPKPMAEGEDTATVEGDALFGTLADHEKACLTLLASAQRQQSTDIPMIAALCNSVRLAREYQQWQMKPVPEGEPKIRLVETEPAPIKESE